MHKTKWSEGWLPLDTYEKRVDSLVTVENTRDWEGLRKRIIKNKGIRNSVVSALMPGESSSLSAGTTNGPYAIRELNLMKTNDTLVNYWSAPDGTKLAKKYQIAWEIKNSDMIKVYAVMQKWTDQAISADLFVKIQDDQKVSSSEMLQDYLDMVKYGLKSRYYVNSLTVGTKKKEEEVPEVVVPVQEEEESPGVCEACAL
jgi:ribonucleoside-diphosphate reductase alpha chain